MNYLFIINIEYELPVKIVLHFCQIYKKLNVPLQYLNLAALKSIAFVLAIIK